jgi:V/A-type H+-transporting ATPase subunit C
MRWDDLNARVRGLSGHLLGRARLVAIAGQTDLAGVARRLRDAGFDIPPYAAASAGALDLALRRVAAARLAVVARWAGPRLPALRVVFEDEDRRSVRAMIRGAIAGVRPAARIAGLIPTPSLPERALEELARQSAPGAVAAMLVGWGDPYGSAILEEATRAHPDPFVIEVALDRAFAARAIAGAWRAGRTMRSFVADAVDVENVRAALVLATSGAPVDASEFHVGGGRRITKQVFEAAASAANAHEAVAILADAWQDIGQAESAEPVTLERTLLHLRIVHMVRLTRMRPLGPGPVLSYALRLRGEVLDLRAIVWAHALGAAREVVADRLVSV